MVINIVFIIMLVLELRSISYDIKKFQKIFFNTLSWQEALIKIYLNFWKGKAI